MNNNMNDIMDKLDDLDGCYVNLYDRYGDSIASGMLEIDGDGWNIDGIYHGDYHLKRDDIVGVDIDYNSIFVET